MDDGRGVGGCCRLGCGVDESIVHVGEACHVLAAAAVAF